MKIFIASDHAGFELKNTIYEHLFHHKHDVKDMGPQTLDPEDDYPQFTFRVTTQVLGCEDKDPRGILVCGSGQGMIMAANRVSGIRAALVWNTEVAKETRQDNNSNVLVLPAGFIEPAEALEIIEVWLKEPFSNAPRHQRRLREIEEMYG